MGPTNSGARAPYLKGWEPDYQKLFESGKGRLNCRNETETAAKERRTREESDSQKSRRWESNWGLRLGSLLPSPLGYRCSCVHALIHQPRSIGRVSAFPIALVQCAKFKRGFTTRIISIAAAVSAVSDSLRQFEWPFPDPN